MAHVYHNKGVHGRPENAGSDKIKEVIMATATKDTEGLMHKIMPCYEKGKKTKAKLAKEYKGQWTEAVLEETIDKYFKYCYEVNFKPTPSSLALWLGVDKSTLYNWVNNRSGRYKFKLAERAYLIMENYLEGNVDKYPTGSIFLLKTTHKHVEQSKIDITSGGKIIENGDVKEMVSKLGLDKK